jgi:hypothetical protein
MSEEEREESRVTLASLCEARDITSEAKHLRFEGRDIEGKRAEWPHDLWAVTIFFEGRRHSIEYRTGTGWRKLALGVKRDRGGYYSHGDLARDDVEAIEKGMLGKPKAPSTADVVSALAGDASGALESFDEWCANLGFSNDSIKALETYRACQKTRDALVKLFGTALLEELAKAEH